MIKGDPKIDAVRLVAFKVDPGPTILTRAELVDSTTDIVHATLLNDKGLGAAAWGDDTLALVKELRGLLERDLAKIHLKQVEEEKVRGKKGLEFPEGGIGELLSSEDAPSI